MPTSPAPAPLGLPGPLVALGVSGRLVALSGPLLALAALLFLAAPGCKTEREVVVIWEGKEEEAEPEGRSEEELREEYEAKKKARENAPEPELDPTEPREKFELVWRMGGGKLQSIYSERAEMIAMLRRHKATLEEKRWIKKVDAWIEPLTEFGIGREPEYMEKAPADLCKLISEARVPAEELIDEGTPELEKLVAQEKELDAKAEAGEEILQKTWDKVDEQRKYWSGPVKCGKEIQLILKSILQEALVLAEHGPRRAQLALRDCLTEVAEKPFALDLAQDALDKALARSKWYRDLR